ncbi:MAG: hypothetical protein WAK93_17465 [Solirubrobacteraceae bacterium]
MFTSHPKDHQMPPKPTDPVDLDPGHDGWMPLERLGDRLGDEIGSFMFMYRDRQRRVYYKHKATRCYLVLDQAGHAYDLNHGYEIPLEQAVRRALRGFDPRSE